jgi:hypothetical protein
MRCSPAPSRWVGLLRSFDPNAAERREHAMALIREVDGDKWQVQQPSPFEAPLVKGLKLVRKLETPDQKEPVTLTYELKDWYYRVDGPNQGELELLVQEVKPNWVDQHFANLPPDWQFMLGGAIPVMISLLILALAFVAYKQPDHTGLWAFMGRNIRWVVGWALYLGFGIVLPVRLRLFDGPTKFSHTFFSFLFSMTGLITALVWLYIAAYPPDFHPSDATYAAFAQSLAAKFSKSYWPYMLAALPWIALGFKTFGLSFAQGATETFAKSRKAGG